MHNYFICILSKIYFEEGNKIPLSRVIYRKCVGRYLWPFWACNAVAVLVFRQNTSIVPWFSATNICVYEVWRVLMSGKVRAEQNNCAIECETEGWNRLLSIHKTFPMSKTVYRRVTRLHTFYLKNMEKDIWEYNDYLFTQPEKSIPMKL